MTCIPKMLDLGNLTIAGTTPLAFACRDDLVNQAAAAVMIIAQGFEQSAEAGLDAKSSRGQAIDVGLQTMSPEIVGKALDGVATLLALACAQRCGCRS